MQIESGAAIKSGVIALYRAFGTDGRLLYVGISVSALARFATHSRTAEWAQKVSRLEVEQYPSREQALEAERNAIARELPLANIHHAGRARRANPLTVVEPTPSNTAPVRPASHYTVKILCRILAVSRSTLNRIRRDDPTFPKPEKIGAAAIRFRIADVEAWILSRPRVGGKP